MPYKRQIREILLLSYDNNLIDDEEFVLLYDSSKSKNPDFPYWNYHSFDLDHMEDDECKAQFRFHKSNVYNLREILRIPSEIKCYNRSIVDGDEALCIFLKRFAYPCRYGDLVPMFGRSFPELSIISNHVMDYIYDTFGHLSTFNQPSLQRAQLEMYADAIHQSGAALQNCWGFIDGTVRPICRPRSNQRILYNGHKRVHSIKFQSVVIPNGLIENLWGPMEGRRHDCALLASSGLLNLLSQNSFTRAGNPLCIYGDPAYPLRVHLQSPFRQRVARRLTPNEELFNKSMSSVRVSVEWIFGEILQYFAFLSFRKNLKIGLSAVGKMYVVCGLLHNARACFYVNNTSNYFGVPPPSIEEYFQ